MSTTTSIYKLKVKFVFATKAEQIRNMFTDRVKTVQVPHGEAHLFPYVLIPSTKPGRKWEQAVYDYSMCHKSRSQIGGTVKETDNRPSLKLCEACEKAYKEHPDSPYKLFSEGTAVKV